MLVDEFNFKDEPPLVGVIGALGVGLVQGAAKKATTQPKRTVGNHKGVKGGSLGLCEVNADCHVCSSPFSHCLVITQISNESLLRKQALMRQQLLTSAGEINMAAIAGGGGAGGLLTPPLHPSYPPPHPPSGGAGALLHAPGRV